MHKMKAHSRHVTQLIRWNPARRMISTIIVVRSSDSPCPKLEFHNERAYSFEEVGRWLMDAGFVIRGVHDEQTLRPASGCPQRIIIVAQRSALR